MEIIEQIERIPALGASGLHIWGAELRKCTTKLLCLQSLLSEEERRKSERFYRAADRDSSILARGALRTLLAAYTGWPAAALCFNYSDTGKPYLDCGSGTPAGAARPAASVSNLDIAFNVSHSGGWVVLAFGRNRQVGVDLEQIRRDLDVLKIAARYFTPEETARIQAAADPQAAFFHHWARKEAYVKAAGSALFRELSSFSVPDEDGEKDGWYFQRLEAGSAYASAVVSDKPMESVRCFEFQSLELG